MQNLKNSDGKMYAIMIADTMVVNVNANETFTTVNKQFNDVSYDLAVYLDL